MRFSLIPHIVLPLLCCILGILAPACNGSENLVVQTQNGAVRGYHPNGYDGKPMQTIAYLGIPYARVERFMPPRPVTPWDTVRNCTSWAPMAMQESYRLHYSERDMSEQCCVLNVWTDNLQTERPVIVWLHGGGYDSGSAAWDPGMYLAQEGAVVVSLHHRLNILGFLDLSAISEKYRHSGNAGMLDIIQGLQWIHDNIAQFGGDPDNVTLMGEAGGADKVATLLCMPAAKELFHKAIIMSGTKPNRNTLGMTQRLGRAVLRQLHIRVDSVERLNDLPYDTLVAAGQRAMEETCGLRPCGAPEIWGFAPTPDGRDLLQQPFSPGLPAIADLKPIIIGSLDLDYDFREFAPAYERSAPTYHYFFARQRFDVQRSVQGHELCYCLNNYRTHGVRLPDIEPIDDRVSQEMCSRWLQFARTGEPDAEWKPYDLDLSYIRVLGDTLGSWSHEDSSMDEFVAPSSVQMLDEFRAHVNFTIH